MGVASFSKMLVPLYQTIWHYITEDYNVKIETIVFEYTFSHKTKFSYLFINSYFEEHYHRLFWEKRTGCFKKNFTLLLMTYVNLNLKFYLNFYSDYLLPDFNMYFIIICIVMPTYSGLNKLDYVYINMFMF